MSACARPSEAHRPTVDRGARSPTGPKPGRQRRARLGTMIRTHDTSGSWLRALALLALLFGCASVARAQSCNTTVVAPNFGQYDPVGTHSAAPNDTASGSVRVVCTPSGNAKVQFSASLGPGQHSTGGLVRRLRSGANHLGYQIYLDAARGQVFGNAGGGVRVTCTAGEDSGYCTGDNQGSTRIATFPIFGRMPGGQDAAPGTYTDTLAVTITF